MRRGYLRREIMEAIRATGPFARSCSAQPIYRICRDSLGRAGFRQTCDEDQVCRDGYDRNCLTTTVPTRQAGRFVVVTAPRVCRGDESALNLTAAAPAHARRVLMWRRGRRVGWKQRPIGGIEVGRAFSVLLVTAVTGVYVLSTGERLVGALVILASLALFAAVWIGYRKQH